MGSEPLINPDSANSRPREPSPICLKDVVNYISSMTNDDNTFDTHICEKVNRQIFKLPEGDEITVLGRMLDGFVVGLKSGKVMIVMPPAVTYIQLHETPIVGLFAASNYFIAVAFSSQCKIWNLLREVEESPLPDINISAVCGNMQKELLFLGLENGTVVLFAIVDKEKCTLERKFELKTKDEVTPAYDIKTTDDGSWVAVKYKSQTLGIWDHVSGNLLYYFTYTDTRGLPNKCELNRETKLSKFYMPDIKKSHMWGVSSHYILFPPGLVIKLAGNHITMLKSWNELNDPEDALLEAIIDSMEKGHVSFQCENYLITFIKASVKKKRIEDKHYPEVEVDLGLTFSLAELSDANNYIAFACKHSLEVLCISAINYKFKHQLTGPVKFSKNQKCFYTRLNHVWDEEKELLPLASQREKVLKVSPTGEWFIICTCKEFKLEQPCLYNTELKKRFYLPSKWDDSKVLYAKFTKDEKFVGLMLSAGFLIYDLKMKTQETILGNSFTLKSAWLKLSLNNHFLITDEDGKVYYDIDIEHPNDKTPKKWEFSRFTFLNHAENKIIAYSASKTEIRRIGQEPELSIKDGFERMKVINSGQHCVGYNFAGAFVMSASNLVKLVRIPIGYELMVSKSAQWLYAFSSDPNAKSYAQVDVWDLKLGIKTCQIYSGLKHVLANKLTVKGPGMWQQPGFKKLQRTDTEQLHVKYTWVCDYKFFAEPPKDVENLKEINLIEEHFERHCLTWKKLAVMLKTGKMQEGLADVLLKPINVNILHLLVSEGNAAGLAQALAQRCRVIQSCYGTPVKIALEIQSKKCLNVILSNLIVLKVQDPSAFLSALWQISGDIPGLISAGSPYLCEFFQQVMMPLPDEIIVPASIVPKANLPFLTLASDLWIKPGEEPPNKQSEGGKKAVEFLVCPFKVHMRLGTEESLNDMKILVQGDIDTDLCGTEFITTFVNEKWRLLWPVVLFLTILYWCFLLSLITIMYNGFDFIDSFTTECFFITLNSWFALMEIFQMVYELKEYMKEFWNYVDLMRISLSYLWIIVTTNDGTSAVPYYQLLTFTVVLLSLLRGIRTFQTFDSTRYYVNMIIKVTLKTIPFIGVFFYSTFAFGLLFAAVRPDLFSDFFSVWTVPYEMNVGSFELDNKGRWYWLVFMAAELINVVIMQNLVVTVLGNAFCEFESKFKAEDIYGKAEMIYELEQMMWWRRCTESTRQYMHLCREDSGEGPQDSQRVTAVKKMLRRIPMTASPTSLKPASAELLLPS